MPMAQLTGPQTDPWANAASKYIRSGVSRGTTTSSAVFKVNTGFPRRVLFAFADQEGDKRRVVANPAVAAQSTYTSFQFISTDDTVGPAIARFRVRIDGL